ncbi:hypothetical protein Vadar_026688 [Vaccinium darrowii]|uniref:Uncharacterized protein n=1 Tax=Vaccinium darrowii TaxID=229202 RepID=A0ACB7XKC7_9ERIC|nr:hypothetical protein Vadar_026688 [Vaccinium darrowii]
MRSLHKLRLNPPNLLSLFHTTPRFLTTQTNPTTSAHYDDLINAAGRDKDFAAVHRLLNKRFKDGFFNTSKTFSFISTDLSILEDLTETLKNLDKGFTRKSAYDALIARLCKLQRVDEARRVAEEMVRKNYGANACTFHPILNALSRTKKMDEAWRVVELMRENRISPDVTAYNFLLTAYCFDGDTTSAAGLLARMEEAGLTADSRTYDALVLGACKAGKVEGALVMLRRMEDDGLPALYSTHAHIISGLLKLGYYAQAVEFVVSCGGRDQGLDTESFGILASRLIGLRRFDEAKVVLEEMRKRGLRMGDKLKDFYNLHVTTIDY